MTAHLTVFQRDLARRLRAGGMSLRDIGEEVGCSHSGIHVVLRGGQAREARAEAWTPRDGSLQAAEREEILLGLQRNESMSAIARALGRSPSTVTREVKSNGGPDGYRVWPAHLRARDATRRPKRAKLDRGPLCDKVTEWLKALWSPEEITNRLLLDYPDDPGMRVSHETIYQCLYVQGRGELRRELARCLRSGRTRRKAQGAAKRTGPVANMVSISDASRRGRRPRDSRPLGISMALSTGDWHRRNGFDVGRVVAQHGPDDVHAPSGQGDECLLV